MNADENYAATAEQFGFDVLGPIIAEFCLRLWSITSQFERPDSRTLLFCARGGLRIQFAYERFLGASRLASSTPVASLMVSRIVALRASLAHTVRCGDSEIGPSAATAVSYEFRRANLANLVQALIGKSPAGPDQRWRSDATPANLSGLLASTSGRPVCDILVDQTELFGRHLAAALAGRDHGVLVDTGFYGTTRQLLAEAFSDIEFSSALIARSHRPGDSAGASRSVGISVDAADYSPIRRRTSLLRHWHFVECLLEPRVPSVRWFTEVGGVPTSNLEFEAGSNMTEPEPGTHFAGVIRYIDSLPAGPAAKIVTDAESAWRRFHRAVVWPSTKDGITLQVGIRSHDFGLTGTWSERTWNGHISALRGASMWREGEIARSGTRWRLPILAGIEAAYGIRLLKRRAVTGFGIRC